MPIILVLKMHGYQTWTQYYKEDSRYHICSRSLWLKSGEKMHRTVTKVLSSSWTWEYWPFMQKRTCQKWKLSLVLSRICLSCTSAGWILKNSTALKKHSISILVLTSCFPCWLSKSHWVRKVSMSIVQCYTWAVITHHII